MFVGIHGAISQYVMATVLWPAPRGAGAAAATAPVRAAAAVSFLLIQIFVSWLRASVVLCCFFSAGVFVVTVFFFCGALQ